MKKTISMNVDLSEISDLQATSAPMTLPVTMKYSSLRATGFDGLYKMFYFSNELGWDGVLKLLSQKPVVGNAIVGVGGFSFLDLVSARLQNDLDKKIQYVFLTEVSDEAIKKWNDLGRFLKKYSNNGQNRLVCTRHDVVEVIERMIAGDRLCSPDTPYGKLMSTKLKEAQTGSYSWLASDTQFEKMVALLTSDRFRVVSLDWTDPKKGVSKFNSNLRAFGISVDTLYISNVAEYALKDGDMDSLEKSVNKLLDNSPDAYVVSSSAQKGSKMTLDLVVTDRDDFVLSLPKVKTQESIVKELLDEDFKKKLFGVKIVFRSAFVVICLALVYGIYKGLSFVGRSLFQGKDQ